MHTTWLVAAALALLPATGVQPGAEILRVDPAQDLEARLDRITGGSPENCGRLMSPGNWGRPSYRIEDIDGQSSAPRQWHPAHGDCRYVCGNSLAVGAVLQVDEELHGRPHSLRLHADVVVPHRSGRGFRGAFVLEPADGGTRFTAELAFGLQLPLVGWLIDRVLERWLASRLAAFRVHMREEGVNLKRLLEPEPRPDQPRQPPSGR